MPNISMDKVYRTRKGGAVRILCIGGFIGGMCILEKK